MDRAPSFQERVAAVKRKLPIGDVIERHVKLSGGYGATRRRGKCPFHGGKSASFSVSTGGSNCEAGFAHCFGCQWHGDVIGFVRDHLGMSFADALAECEVMAGIAGAAERPSAQATGPIVRERNPAPQRERRFVEPADMGRVIWKLARPDFRAVQQYFHGRGVPIEALTEERLCEFRYLADCPVMPWVIGARPRSVPIAPAVMVLMKRPVMTETGLQFMACGLHVTFLNPDGTGTMIRRKPWAKPDDEDALLPKRRMLGESGGACVVLGRYDPAATAYIGEGNETVLSAMALDGAGAGCIGIATLSLDNLQGAPKLWQGRHGRIWPLFRIEPSDERPPFDLPGHKGAVIGLIDSDMSPLRGMRDPRGAFVGEAVVERKGGPIVRRPITGMERAQICSELFVRAWRVRGVRFAEARRAPLGMDFNDVINGGAG